MPLDTTFPAPRRLAVVLLWLLVIFVGVQFGAGLYEKIVVVQLWDDVAPREVLAAMEQSGMKDAGRHFWPYVSPAVVLLAVANIVVARRARSASRRWWLAAGILMLTYGIFSYSFFVPQMLMLQGSGDSWSEPRIETLVQWWTGLNYVRMLIGAAGWFCALRALSLSNATPPATRY